MASKRASQLEKAFFHDVEQKQLDALRKGSADRAARDAVRDALGIDDEELIGRLIELDLSPETAAAMMLVPLVEVAWADGSLAERERAAVLEAAASEGIVDGTAAHGLLSSWLGRRPDDALLDTWADYIAELTDSLTEAQRTTLHEVCLGRARHVAEAAGGFLGLAKISAREEAMLERLDNAFHAS